MMSDATLTERGQISVPASLRRSMKLRAGQRLRFAQVSDHEFRVITTNQQTRGAMAMLGFGLKNPKGPGRRTDTVMDELRAGEKNR